MSSAKGYTPGEWAHLAELEKGLLLQIDAAELELQRIECLDQEQRAEIHAILQALKHDSQTHASMIASLGGEVCHA
jgi:hypothetical protein